MAIDKDKYLPQLLKVIAYHQQCLQTLKGMGAAGQATLEEFTIEFLNDLVGRLHGNS